MNLANGYNLLIDTLIMVSPDFEKITKKEIEGYIEELEGDYYTFFDHINLIPLQNLGLLNDFHIEQITILKHIISNIPAHLWNNADFRDNSMWMKAREVADNLLSSLGVSKRIIE
ncbi:hypothetical protein [Mucilaginibacter sp. SG564]|uniref:hypothetical protein n=1 Tax=Mucilaginibacter sp. SG564 TaxID=2587022 RepID=UPI0015523D4B|nr:hypothetical protein [Mucilaginibacter sp. SG564]NOW95866.1 hypothetical protein [Mucilaginibacter sp. SG564]